MNLPALRLVHAQSRRPEGLSGRPKGWKPYLFLLPSRRNLTGDFHRFPPADALLIEPANERSNSCAIISPTALNLCPTNGATDADNHVHQNEQRDFMARATPEARSWMKLWLARLFAGANAARRAQSLR